MPENGSPLRNLTKRMSPTCAASRFERAKRRAREDVGSRMESCCAVNVARGVGHLERVEGGGG